MPSSTSAPYWGQLPEPKARRPSGSGTLTPDRRQSLDTIISHQPIMGQYRSNRDSTQTTNTNMMNDPTYTTLTEPNRSSYQGSASRQPPVASGVNQYPPELLENRRRRRSKNHEQDHDYTTNSAAPNGMRGPPLSSPNSGPHYTTDPSLEGASRAARQPQGPISPMDASFKDRQRELPILDHTRDTLGVVPNGTARRNGTDPSAWRSSGMTDMPSRPHQRRGSVGDSGRRDSMGQGPDRKKFADDRSPLQRLELTLDSITKEEKRALAEAAERAARDKSTTIRQPAPTLPPPKLPEYGGSAQQREAVPQQVRFSERAPPPALAVEVPRTKTRRPEEIIPPPMHQSKPVAQLPPENGQRFAENVDEPSPQTHGTEPRNSVGVLLASQDMCQVPPAMQGQPQRNLSFRERAATKDVVSGVDLEPPTTPVTNPSGTMARGTSNKLRKNPPTASSAPVPPVPLKGEDPRSKEQDEAQQHIARNGSKRNEATVRMVGPTSHGPSERSVRLRDPDGGDLTTPSGQKHVVLDREVIPSAAGGQLSHAPSQRNTEQFFGQPAPFQNNSNRRTYSHQGSGSQIAVREGTAGAAVAHAGHTHRMRRDDTRSDTDSSDDEHHHRVSNLIYGHSRTKLQPGQGMYKPPTYLDEWRKATVGTLSGALLDLTQEQDQDSAQADKDKAWWETPPSKRRGSVPPRARKAEAFDGEYDDTHAPTRFKPPLYLKCGPLLRFCGIRTERGPSRAAKNEPPREREIWRGSVMIVTQDADSSYDIAPTLRLFVQPIELLPPPPAEIHGELSPEHVDPLAGHPKLGRKGETLYVRPVDHLREGKDLSRDESDNGLFEKTRSSADKRYPNGATDPPGSFAARKKRAPSDGEKASKYKDVRGFRLHAERGYTFWRFNIEVELREEQQRIAYRINRGPSTGFWVPAKGTAMNIMFHSCNGFSLTVPSDEFSGPDPMWRDVLNAHQSTPFHVMIGGGDQIYNDAVMRQTRLFQEWLMIRNPLHKHNAPFTPQLQDELETFYLERYSMWFSQGLFGMANSQIPMVNMYDDHDIIDGFGSYPHHFMVSPVFSGLGNVAFKYYMLFQHQSVPAETEVSEPSWALGLRPGPYIHERSRSLFMSLGGAVALLAVDARTERTRDDVVSEETWKKLMDRCYEEIAKGKVHHLLVLLGVPIAYPRLVWLENILTSRLLDPVKALGKAGLLGNFLNKFDGGVEVLDDLDDHWTAKNHKDERAVVVEDLQDLAADKSVRVTILSGDVHLAAVGQFYSNPKLALAKHNDFRYMPNVISSAIVNTPPPDMMADILNKRNKVHHFDKETDEDMIPMFSHGVDGKPRNNKHLLPHRNWCSIRSYVPGNTPPQTPLLSPSNRSLTRPAGIVRRLSKPYRAPSYRGPDAVMDKSRPPVSSGFFRSFSRRRASVDDVNRPSPGFAGNGTPLQRSLSLSDRVGNIFRRYSSTSRSRRHDDGGINGTWGDETESDSYTEDEITAPEPLPRNHQYPQHPPRAPRQLPVPPPRHQYASPPNPQRDVSLRGGGPSSGGGYPAEYNQGDDSYFTVKPAPSHANPPPLPPKGVFSPPAQPPRAQTFPAPGRASEEWAPRPFHRTPTTLSRRDMKRADQLAVNLEGGLEICLNVEVNRSDPAGITVPYRLLVPRLWYEEDEDEADMEGEKYVEEERGAGGAGGAGGGGIKRLIGGLRRKSLME